MTAKLWTAKDVAHYLGGRTTVCTVYRLPIPCIVLGKQVWIATQHRMDRP